MVKLNNTALDHLYIVWLGPSPSLRPKVWFGLKLGLHTHDYLNHHHKQHRILARAGCVRYLGTKCPLLMALFSLLSSLSSPGYFSPRRGYFTVPKFCVGFKVTKQKRFRFFFGRRLDSFSFVLYTPSCIQLTTVTYFTSTESRPARTQVWVGLNREADSIS